MIIKNSSISECEKKFYFNFRDFYRYQSGVTGYGYGGSGSYGTGGGSGAGVYPSDIPSTHFRGGGAGRGYQGDGYQADWRPSKDFRRDYDRPRPPPNPNS